MSQEETGTSVNAENIAIGKSAIKKSSLSLAERLGLVGYRNQSRSEIKPHIVVDTDICNSSCPHRCHGYAQPTATLDQKCALQWRIIMRDLHGLRSRCRGLELSGPGD